MHSSRHLDFSCEDKCSNILIWMTTISVNHPDFQIWYEACLFIVIFFSCLLSIKELSLYLTSSVPFPSISSCIDAVNWCFNLSNQSNYLRLSLQLSMIRVSPVLVKENANILPPYRPTTPSILPILNPVLIPDEDVKESVTKPDL